eukprot:2191523-Ditylum_brightwellii.AAC.1
MSCKPEAIGIPVARHSDRCAKNFLDWQMASYGSLCLSTDLAGDFPFVNVIYVSTSAAYARLALPPFQFHQTNHQLDLSRDISPPEPWIRSAQ